MRVTFDLLTKLVAEKNHVEKRNLVVERQGDKVHVWNNSTGISGEYDTLAEAYSEVYHNLI